MEAADYRMAWIIYLGAGLFFMLMLWWFTKRYFQRDLAYITQGLFAALIFTPWYVYPDQDYMAPALMVFLMDTITLSTDEAIRPLIPLVAGIILALVITIGRSIFARVIARRRKTETAKKAETAE